MTNINKEYIEREAAVQQFYTDDSIFRHGAEGCSAIISKLRTIPTADVVEVRHGYWIERRRGQKSPEGYYYWNTPLTTVFVCSECGRHEDKKEPYCHCGAKMDGDTNE